jgi:hypothetical protein
MIDAVVNREYLEPLYILKFLSHYFLGPNYVPERQRAYQVAFNYPTLCM